MKDATLRFITGVFDDGDFDLVKEMTTDGYSFNIARPGSIPKKDFEGVISEFRSTFASVRNTFDEQVVEGNVVVTRGTTHVTQAVTEDDPSTTAKQASVPWVVFTRFEGDLISEHYEVWDELGLMYQLGAIPEPE
jgi:predicted ester cyclase